jgi:hypothetical protein
LKVESRHDNPINRPPWFFVNVASKGLRVYVSGLESTLADISISVDSKEFPLHQNCAKWAQKANQWGLVI